MKLQLKGQKNARGEKLVNQRAIIGINNKIETDHNQWRPTLKNKQAKKIGGRQPPIHERIL